MTRIKAAAGKFFEELRRRKVFRVAVAYSIVAWIVIQIAANTFPALHLPDWSMTFVVIVTILGFPIAIVLAWSLEITPHGILQEERSVAAGAETHAQPARRIARISTSQRRPMPPLVPSPVPTEDAVHYDPVREKRAILARARHDLRTPMNAIIGFSEVIIEEAQEIGAEAIVADVQRVHVAAKRLLEQMDVQLPAGIDVADCEPDAVRARLGEALTSPTGALLKNVRKLCERASEHPGVAPDLERIRSAAEKMSVAVAALGAAQAPDDQPPHDSGFTRVFRAGSSREQAPAAVNAQIGTLLVVDDNPLNCDLLTRQLVRDGYSVFAAASGREALEKLRLHRFDLMLLDVLMPEMDGLEVLEAVQRDAQLAEMPVLMISALDEMDAVARCIERGAVDYLAKPFDPVLLRARVSLTLQLRWLRGELRGAEDALTQRDALLAQLSRSVAPAPFGEDVARGAGSPAAHYPEVTAVVVQFEGLEAIASRRGADAMLAHAAGLLALAERCSRTSGLSIASMSGRSYAVLAGAPEWSERHAHSAAEFARDVLKAADAGVPGIADPPQIRIGIHTGGAIAGLLVLDGADKLAFSLWGDALSTAEAIARQSQVGAIRVSASTVAKLHQQYAVANPSTVQVPGQGHLRTYVLGDRASAVQ